MGGQASDFACIADVILTWGETVLLLAALALAPVGAGIVMIMAGRVGMKAKNISPGWRAGYTILFIGGWLFIVLGIGFSVAATALAILR